MLYHRHRSIEMYAMLYDGSEHTIPNQYGAQQFQLQGEAEDFVLRTVQQDHMYPFEW